MCEKGFSACVFVKGVYLGYCDGIFLVRELCVSSGQEMEVSWEILEWTLSGWCGRLFGWKV